MSKKVWCNRCNRYHNSDPVDPKKIIEKHAMDIAKHIDQEVIESLKSIHKGAVASATRMVASEFQKRTENKGEEC